MFACIHLRTVLRKDPSSSVAAQGGSLWQLPPPNIYAAPLKWRPSDTNAPFLVYIQVETDILKNLRH